MKKTKILCAVIAVIMLAAVFTSCKNKDRGILLAKYDGGEVYSNDKEVIDWTNYWYNYTYDFENKTETRTKEEIAELTIYSVVYPKIMEADLKEKGVTVTKEDIKSIYDYNKANYDEYYEGGFEKFKEDSGLDDDFFMLFAKKQVVEEAAQTYLTMTSEITEDELLWYYNENYNHYTEPAGYNYSVLVVEVLDLASDEEWANKKAEAQGYIDRIGKGETYDTIKDEILKKYTSDGGYTQTQFATGSYSAYESDLYEKADEIKNKEDLAAALAEAANAYPTQNKNADKDSNEYKAYLKYLTLCGNIAQSYAIKNLKEGETYSEPLMFQAGWTIIKFNKFNEKTYYPTLEEVKNEVIADYIDYLVSEGTQMKEYSKELTEKYHFVIEEFYVS